MGDPYRIRPLEPDDPDRADAVALVAQRMRATLVEVLGQERGTSLYTLEWLEARVRWHLSPDQCTGRVFLAEPPDGRVLGHTIVRVEKDQEGRDIGLFSTTYVVRVRAARAWPRPCSPGPRPGCASAASPGP